MNDVPELLKLFVLGGAAGVLSGMFGIGGGLVIVPALVLLFGLDIKTATGTSLFVILLPTGLLGVLEYYKNGHMKMYYWVPGRVRRIRRRLFWCEACRHDFRVHNEALLRGVSVDRRGLFFAFAADRAEAGGQGYGPKGVRNLLI